MFGLSLNTMSIGGLVVALGVVVDDAVIDVENITRRRRNAGAAGAELDARQLFVEASLEVRLPVFYATAAVAVALLPIFMLTGIQGTFFRPLSLAFLLAVGISLVVAMSATPALCAVLMRRHKPPDEARFLLACKRFQRQHDPEALRAPARGAGLVLGTGVAGAVLLPLFGQRLLPDFRENYLIAHASLRPGISLRETSARRRADLQAAGRDSRRRERRRTDRPRRERPGSGRTERERVRYPDQPRQGLYAGSDRGGHPQGIRRFPNQLTEIYSVLAERIGETLSGETAPFFVSVFGNDLDTDDAVAARDRRGAAEAAARRRRAPGGPAARAGAVCATAARAAGAVRTAGQRRAAGSQCGLPRHHRRPARAGRPHHSGGRAHSRCRCLAPGGRGAAAARLRWRCRALVGARAGGGGVRAQPDRSRRRTASPGGDGKSDHLEPDRLRRGCASGDRRAGETAGWRVPDATAVRPRHRSPRRTSCTCTPPRRWC